ncbi:MAG: flagellin lysine-N-methylase, partial [Butyrivibrio sp.]|nr:flagellin lysine-N-methylase [Butyrivibrio sp.]
MKYLELETFTDFKCVGSECPFTCCAGGWRIIIDKETDKYYKSVTGDFGDRLNSSIKEEKGDSCFVLTEEGRCSFLNKDNLCDIYMNLGEEHLCYTCTVYPRYFFVVGDI